MPKTQRSGQIAGIVAVAVLTCLLTSSWAAAQVPPNAIKVGDQWVCQNGFKRVGDHCERINVPANAIAVGDQWVCQNGYRRVSDHCERVAVPANGIAVGDQWVCQNGFKKTGDRCESIDVPRNAIAVGDQWVCQNGYKRVGNRCEELKVPQNATAVGDQWTCNLGFKQEGSICVEMSASEKAAQLASLRKRMEPSGAYRTKVESDSGDVLVLRNGAVVEVTSGYVGYIGYSNEAVLFKSGLSWRIWIEGKRAYPCKILKAPGGTNLAVREVSISNVARDGEILVLSDGSVYEVSSIDTIHTSLWLSSTTVLLLDSSEIINPDDGDLVRVTKLR